MPVLQKDYSSYLFCIIIFLLLIIVFLLILALKRKTSQSEMYGSAIQNKADENNSIEPVKSEEVMAYVPVEPILYLPECDEKRLVEISDKEVLSRLDNLIPGLARASATGIVNAGLSGETLYRAILPQGEHLTASKSMEGAVRGVYHNQNGINGDVNFVAKDLAKANAVNLMNVAMSVASVVVGQYYMTKINQEMGKISESIDNIASFQETEYKSKVMTLANQVAKVSAYKAEILNNDELRKNELIHLDKLEDECAQLLTQANMMILNCADGIAKDFETYESIMLYIQMWVGFQQALMSIINEIANMKYLLHKGSVSRKQCSALLPNCERQVVEVQKALNKWHEESVAAFGIDISSGQRLRTGVDKVIHWLPGLFNDDFNFKSFDPETAEMIDTQTANTEWLRHPLKEGLFNEDVQIISKGGKLFYLPSE